MTIEEAIEKEKSIAKSNHELANSYHTDFNVYMRQGGACRERAEYHEQVAEWLEELQRLKEQEPCDDAISRQEVLNNAYAYGNGLEPDGYCVNVEDIQALPPVTPQPRSEVLDKIYADIQRLRGCSCSCSDGIIDDVEDILDKYKAESEEIHERGSNGFGSIGR